MLRLELQFCSEVLHDVTELCSKILNFFSMSLVQGFRNH